MKKIHWTPARASLAAAAFATIAVQTWFRPGRFIAAGDTRPFLRSFDGMASLWNHQFTGTGSTGYPTSSLLEAVLHELVITAGGSSTFAQRLFYTLLVSGVVLAAGFLAGALTRNPAAVAAAGLTALLNPFHITTLPNPLPMVALISIALVLGVAARYLKGQAVHPAYGFGVAIIVSLLAKNPPLLTLFILVSVGGLVAVLARAPGQRHRAVRFVSWFVAGSLFWVVPLVLHYLTGTPGLTVVAETNVSSWSWTQRNSGPVNVVTLVASWVWGDPGILPATATLSQQPWSVLRFGLPALVLLSVLISRTRLAYSVAGTAAFLAVLSVGVNRPFGGFNRAVAEVIPGFWLFRQPMSKFGVLLVLCYAVLTALGVDAFARRRSSGQLRPAAVRGIATTGAVLISSAVLFAHPLLIGTVIPGPRPNLPSARVELPSSFLEAGRWLDYAPGDGSVLMLPLSDYYQRGTTWGFYGTDDLLTRVSSRPVLSVLPGGYYESSGTAPSLIRSAERALLLDDGPGLVSTLQALGVSYVGVRTDYHNYGRPRQYTASSEVLAAAERNDALTLAAEFDHVRFFTVGNVTRTSASASYVNAVGIPAERYADLAAATGGVPIISDTSQAGEATAWLSQRGESTFTWPNDQGPYIVAARPQAPLLWQADVKPVGDRYQVTVRLRTQLAVDGLDVVDIEPVAVLLSSEPVALIVGESIVALDATGRAQFQASGRAEVKVVVTATSTGAADVDASTLGNCNNKTALTLDAAGIAATVDAVSGVISMRASAGSACLGVPAPDTPELLGRLIWQVSGTFERSQGEVTRVCFWLPVPQVCATGSPPSQHDRAGRFVFLTGTEKETTDGAKLMLYADASPGGSASVQFRDVQVAALRTHPRTLTLPQVSTTRTEFKPTKGMTSFEVEPELVANVLSHVSPTPGNCNRRSDTPESELGHTARELREEPGQAFEITARHHSACVYGKLNVQPGVRYLTVDLEHRVVTGRPGRWCLILPGSQPCAASGTLNNSQEWSRLSAEVVLPPSDPVSRSELTPYRLYFYADGQHEDISAAEPTVVQYRSVSVRPTYGFAAAAFPRRDTGHQVELTSTGRRSAIVSASGPFLLTHREAHATQWGADGFPTSVDVSHVTVDGWANGWLVVPPGDGTWKLQFRYRHDLAATVATLSLVPVALGALTALLGSQRRRLRDAGPVAGQNAL